MQTTEKDDALPGAGLEPARMPGHWLLARLGKRVLRPGGVELTRWMLDSLPIRPADRVVELAAGLGATARMAIARHPASYTAVDRDPAAIAAIYARAASGVPVSAHHADAVRTGLPDRCATVVYGEAMLTMQPEPAKRRVVAEARRLLADGGRYAIHELCLQPDDLDPAIAARICAQLSHSIHVGARPLTVPAWRALLEAEGFRVVGQMRAPMHLLEPRRLIADEGGLGALRIAGRLVRDPVARRRVLHMRRVFRRYGAHLAAVALIAEAPNRADQTGATP